MKTFITLLILLFISGCAEGVQLPEDDYRGNTFALIGDWTDSEKAIFQKDVKDWNVADVKLGDEGDSVIELAEYEVILAHCAGGYAYACNEYQVINGRRYSHIYVRNVRGIEEYEDVLRRVVLHELGHHIGNCDAHLGKGNIMAAGVEDQPEELSKADYDYRVHCPE